MASVPQSPPAPAPVPVPAVTAPVASPSSLMDKLAGFVPAWLSKVSRPDNGVPAKFEDALNGTSAVLASAQYREHLSASLAMPITQSMQVSHNFTLGPTQAQKYSFLAFLVEELGKDSMMVLRGQINDDGALDGTLRYQLNKNLKLGAQFSSFSKIDAEYSGADWVGSLAVVNPDVCFNTLQMEYAQSITKNFSMGVQAEYTTIDPAMMGIPADAPTPAANDGVPMVALTCMHAKYEGKDWTAAAAVQHSGTLIAQYVRRITPKMHVASQFSYNLAKNASSLEVGYATFFRFAECRGSIDSTGTVTGLVEKQINPMMRFSFGGTIGKQQTFGFNLRFG